MRTMERLKDWILKLTHDDRVALQEQELLESLVDNYNLDTMQKAIMVKLARDSF